MVAPFTVKLLTIALLFTFKLFIVVVPELFIVVLFNVVPLIVVDVSVGILHVPLTVRFVNDANDESVIPVEEIVLLLSVWVAVVNTTLDCKALLDILADGKND